MTIEYMAGILDGEGSISILKSGQRKDGLAFWKLVIQVTSASQELIDWIYSTFGGYKYIEEHKDRRRTYYKWMLLCRHASDFLTYLLPHLKVKKRQAQIGIQFQTSVLPPTGSSGKRTEEVYLFQTKLREELLELNKRL